MNSPIIPLQSFFENLSEAVLVTKEDGTPLWANNAYSALTGFTLEEVITKASTLTGQQEAIGEILPLRKDGNVVPCQISKSPILIADGTKALVYLFIDQTALAESRSKLEQVNEEFNQFVYAASHDMQEPLRMVASYIQLIEKKLQKGETADVPEFMQYVSDGAQRMQALINDLLVISRVNRRGDKLAEVNLNECVQAAIRHLTNQIADSNATITTDTLPKIHCDSSQVTLLFQKLLENALKYKSQNVKPEVHISVEDKGTHYRFGIRDNGIGIEKKFHDRIFILFQRLHSRAEYDGTGAGLAVCKKIVDRHGGKIWVESEPGKGSTFYFTIKKSLAAI